jgi:PAS domain S-box-containing protein
MQTSTTTQQLLAAALTALESGDGWRAVLDELPVPVYTTDAEGLVTFWNRACVDFAGREPQLGKDQWCVTWRIHTPSDDFLPHDRCPMAIAIQEQREVHGTVAIAMRPDGSRKAFAPYPTPLFDKAGRLTGAVNLLVDVSAEQADALAVQAERCRRLARTVCDRQATDALNRMAEGYERNVEGLRAAG